MPARIPNFNETNWQDDFGEWLTQTRAIAESAGTERAASGKGVVIHGANAATARPTGYASVEWIGSVQPANMANGDTWVVTS